MTPPIALLSGLLLLGCNGGSGIGGTAGEVLDDLDDATFSPEPATATFWAAASAPNAYTRAQLPILEANDSPDCPGRATDGDATTYTGDCTTTEGVTWSGTARVVRREEGSGGTRTIAYTGFGTDVLYDGEFGDEATATTLSYTIDLAFSGAVTGGLHHVGGLVTQGNPADPERDDPQLWNGRGHYGDTVHGVAAVTTEDELLDVNGCDTEAMSGSTTIASAEHTIVFAYDGATKCDATNAARWSLDGIDQGEVAGIGCNAGGIGGSGAALLIAIAMVARRKRTRLSTTAA